MIKVNHNVVFTWDGNYKFVKFGSSKEFNGDYALYKLTNKLHKKLFNLKMFLVIYKEENKFKYLYTDLKGTQLEQNTKQKSLGNRTLKRRNKKTKVFNKKTTTRKSKPI